MTTGPVRPVGPFAEERFAMHLREFLRAGHCPTLFAAFLYFDVSFMVWTLIGGLANFIGPAFELDAFRWGVMLAIPILSGSLLRLVLGPLADHLGARRVGLLGLAVTLLPLLLGWLWADSFPRILVVGLLLGVAGASFAAALPLASRWYPPQYQGLAMGIAGAGNSGTALASFFCPFLVMWLGSWQAVFGLALLPVLGTLVIFFRCAQDSPHQPPAKRLADYLGVLRLGDTWWFCLFYSFTFGGFVGFAMFLPTFFKSQYGLTPQAAGLLATLCVIAGSFLRPVGGYLADRFGGIRILTALFILVGLLLVSVSTLPASVGLSAVLLFLALGLLGTGNGSVFQLVPQRFAREIGVVTGLVGAAGGIGGFGLNLVLGALKNQFGTYAGGFLIFALLGIGCAGCLLVVGRSWEGVFLARGGLAWPVAGPGPSSDGAGVTPTAEPLAGGFELVSKIG
jgi:MFS transporter, NNP family, nitrate/nitrite transporter